MLYDIDQITRLLGSGCNIPPGKAITNIVIDSRKVTEGSIFIAIKGENFDGHNYIKDAIQGGAVLALANYNYKNKDNLPIIYVDNYLQALRKIAAYNRARMSSKIIAVTGSLGKTTVKEMLRCCFAGTNFFCSYGNYNSQIGLPLLLANMDPNSDYGIFEMGMSFSGEMTKLTELAKPDIAIITTIDAVHIEHFSSVEDIARAKAEIFKSMHGKKAILPIDNQYYSILRNLAKEHQVNDIVTFGFHKDSDFRITDYKYEQDKTQIRLTFKGQTHKYNLKCLGEQFIYNSAASISASITAGLDAGQIIDNIQNFAPYHGRLKTHKLSVDGKRISLINDSYNASPKSFACGLQLLSELKSLRKLAIMADMGELGINEANYHIELAEVVKKCNIDKVIAVGPLMKHLYRHLPSEQQLAHYNNWAELTNDLWDHLMDGDAVLVKGSNGTKIHKIADIIIEKAREEANAL